MRKVAPLLIPALLMGANASAQTIVRNDENLKSDRPEAWAMNYFAASTLMTSAGETPELKTGEWAISLDLGEIPHLSEEQRRAGFNGIKQEDLNKSPVFGRLRVHMGLPAGWVGEIGYSPEVSIDGARPRNLFAIALGRRFIERGNYTLSARVFGQHGGAGGDITCPRDLAGIDDIERNPYGCQAASNDRIALNYYGGDATSSWTAGPWHWHATLGVLRTETQVQVDALTFDAHDRSRLVAKDVLPFFVVGGGRDIGHRWAMTLELLHVPLDVRREPEASRENDPLTSVRIQLRYRSYR
ncbi:hypothetical protein [Lysobacter terrae]